MFDLSDVFMLVAANNLVTIINLSVPNNSMNKFSQFLNQFKSLAPISIYFSISFVTIITGLASMALSMCSHQL